MKTEQFNLLMQQEAFCQRGHPYHKNVDVSDMCANLSYLLVLPLTPKEAEDQKNFNTQPFIVTYEDQNKKVYQLVSKYRSMNPNAKDQYTYFAYKNEFKLGQEMTMRQVMKQLGRTELNDLVLYTMTSPEFAFKTYEEILESGDDDIYTNQSAVTQFLDKQIEFGNKKDFRLTVQIPLNYRKMPEVITVNVEGTLYGNELKDMVLNQIKLQFGVNLTENDMQALVIKETKDVVKQHDLILSQKIFHDSTLVQNLKNKNLKLRRLFTKDYKSELIVYNLGQTKSKKFDYNEISQFTFEKLYSSFLELDSSKQRKDLSYGLKIQDIIIKPNEKISKAKAYFERQTQKILSVVGKVIDQKMIFHYTIPSLLNKSEEFKIDKYITIPPHQQKKRSEYRDLLRAKAKSTLNQYFKIEERLQPILIYTAELYYFQNEKEGKTATIYQSLNRFLRTTPILSLDLDIMKKEWRYLYSNALLTHLKKIPSYVGKAFRGISYNPEAYVGKVITFKQFLSTSTKRQVALAFGKKSQDKLKRIFEFNLLQGYPITQFSIYTGEQEVLLQPFSDFEVVQIKKSTEKVSSLKDGKKIEEQYEFQVYVLQQLLTSKTLPGVRANFIVWIDDKPKEGQIIFSRIDMPQEITVFVQLLSTACLEKWLNDYNFLFKDKTANLIFISNMTRKEGDQLNEIAGIQGLNVIRKFTKDAQVFFYVGNLQRLEQKLVQNNVDKSRLLNGVKGSQVFKYITDRIRQGK